MMVVIIYEWLFRFILLVFVFGMWRLGMSMYDWVFMLFGEFCGDDIVCVVLKWGGIVEKIG